MDETQKHSSDRFSKTAWLLSFAGLVPFFALAIAVVFFGKSNGYFLPFVTAFKVYGAVILSFLGGIRWGLSLLQNEPKPTSLIISVLPSILGWVAVLMSNVFGVLILLFSFCAQGAWDSFSLGSTGVGKWFASLRTTITFFVAIAHIVVLFSVL